MLVFPRSAANWKAGEGLARPLKTGDLYEARPALATCGKQAAN